MSVEEPIKNPSIITRIAVNSRKVIDIQPTLFGKTNIIDFGIGNRQIDIMGYEFKDNSILNMLYQNGELKPNKDGIEQCNTNTKGYKLFSDDFSGDIYIQNISDSEYSSTSYVVKNISAVADSKDFISSDFNSGDINKIEGLDNVYYINYSTQYIEGIGTGYSLTIGSKTEILDSNITFKYNNKEIVFGDEAGKNIGSGVQMSRTTKSYTTSFGDSLNLALQKTIIISASTNIGEEGEAANNELVEMVNNGKRNSKISFYNKSEFERLIIDTVNKGYIGKFLKELFSGTNVKIDDKLETSSKIVEAIRDNSSGVFKGRFLNQFFSQIQQNITTNQILSIGAVINQILSIFGLELYYIDDGVYSLEAPRFIEFNERTKIQDFVFTSDKIISVNSQESKMATPSLVIPQIDFSNMALSYQATKCNQIFVKSILEQLSELDDLPVFRIETYQVPNILVPEYSVKNKDILLRQKDYLSKVWLYTSSLSFKSKFSQMYTGTINTIFMPEIKEAYKWYPIATSEGLNWYFITSINHSIQKGSANTSFTYAGRYVEKIYNAFDNAIKTIKSNKDLCNNLMDREIEKKKQEKKEEKRKERTNEFPPPIP